MIDTSKLTPYRFVQLCSSEEGYDASGKIKDIPTDRNNPMDLRHSPHSSHFNIDLNAIGEIDTIEHGFQDANRQSELWAERGLNLQQAIFTLAPPNENNTYNYLAFVEKGLGVASITSMEDVLKIPSVSNA
jgi:hypothetical protein